MDCPQQVATCIVYRFDQVGEGGTGYSIGVRLYAPTRHMVLNRVIEVSLRVLVLRGRGTVMTIEEWVFAVLWLVVMSQHGGWQSGTVGCVSHMASPTLEGASEPREVGML